MFSEKLEKAREFIRGGQLTDTLEAIGDIHFRSANEHLRQASRSTLQHDRLVQAASDLQVAFFAFDQAAAAGPIQWLRIRTDWPSVTTSHDRASGCASTIALIQWVLGESEQNRRVWVDRTAQHLVDYLKKARSRIVGDHLPKPWNLEFSLLSHKLLDPYYRFERNVLPAGLVRPMPGGWIPNFEGERLISSLLDIRNYDEYFFPKYELH
jgi:hypothetical protein